MAPDGELERPVSSLDPPPRATPERPTLIERLMALLEVVICSGYPTQLALGATFAGFGVAVFRQNGELNLDYVVLVSLSDAVLLVGLIVLFLRVHDERPRELFLDGRRIGTE